MMTDHSSISYRNGHHLSRWAAFTGGLVIGLLSGVLAGTMRLEGKHEEISGWTSPFTFVSAERLDGDTRYFVRNGTTRDYRILSAGQVALFERQSRGLVPSEAKVLTPAYLPASETAAVTVAGAGNTNLVMLDTSNRYKVELGGKP